VFELLKNLSAGQPCDFTGIRDYQHIDNSGGIQWPYPEAMTTAIEDRDADSVPEQYQERRLFADGRFFHADGRARLLFEAPRPMPEPPNADYPLILLTGRGTAVQWHTQTRTAKSAVLRKLSPATIYVEINPADARRFGVQ